MFRPSLQGPQLLSKPHGQWGSNIDQWKKQGLWGYTDLASYPHFITMLVIGHHVTNWHEQSPSVSSLGRVRLGWVSHTRVSLTGLCPSVEAVGKNELIHIVAKVLFLVVGLRAPLLCWPLAEGCSQPLEAARIPCHREPLHLKAKHGDFPRSSLNSHHASDLFDVSFWPLDSDVKSSCDEVRLT